MTPRRAVIPALALLAAATNLDAQGTAEAGAAWSASVSLFQYFIPDEPDYAIAEGMADWGRWHLEGRWNYEDIHAASLFAGWTLSFGRTLEVELTPMAGLVVGSVFGVAPGLELSASLGPFELYVDFCTPNGPCRIFCIHERSWPSCIINEQSIELLFKFLILHHSSPHFFEFVQGGSQELCHISSSKISKKIVIYSSQFQSP